MASKPIYKKKTSSVVHSTKFHSSHTVRVSRDTIALIKKGRSSQVEVLSLSEAINRCNERLENRPRFDFRGVKVVK